MFGLNAVNNNNQLLFSDRSYVLEFVAKATWVRRYDVQTVGGYNPRWMTIFSEVKSCPIYVINEFTVSVPYDQLLAFSYVTFPSYTAILYQTQIDANTTKLLVVSQLYEQPQVYCFKKMTPSGGGYGLKLFDAAGNETFSTNKRVLIPQAASVVSVSTTPWSVQQYSVNTDYSFNVNGPSQTTEYYSDHALISAAPSLSKPAINFHSQMTCVTRSGVTGGLYAFCEPAVRYNAGTSTIQMQHGSTAINTYIGGSPVMVIPAHSVFSMVIDGAYYD